MRPARQPLRIAAIVELVSLTVLLINLVTVHWPDVSSLAGPTHGCAYLFVVIAAARDPLATRRTVATALVPGIGGLLVLRQLAELQHVVAQSDPRPAARSVRR